jgi:hypothetical protein
MITATHPMTKDIECREGEEAAERFREMIKKVVSM